MRKENFDKDSKYLITQKLVQRKQNPQSNLESSQRAKKAKLNICFVDRENVDKNFCSYK